MPIRRLLTVAIIAAAIPVAAKDDGLTVERTVLLMRHGVRAPLSDPAMRAGIAAEAWQKWPVPRKHLTAHGYAAVEQLGVADRAIFPMARAGCPAVGKVLVYADNDQRTIETGRAWEAGFAPNCKIERTAPADGIADPVFAAIEARADPFDPAQATAAVQRRLPPGGLAALDARHRPLIDRLDALLCGRARRPGCGVWQRPTALRPARPGHEPALTGALADSATAIQVLTLEYAENMPAPGWGRVRPRDLRELGALRAIGYEVVQRTPYVASAFGGPTLRRMTAALEDRVLTLLIGHDSNIAAVAGLLDLHWQAPGFAADDPPLSGAIGLQRLRDSKGRHFVRAIFRSPALDEIRRGGTVAPRLRILPIPACNPTPRACPADRFARIVAGAIPS